MPSEPIPPMRQPPRRPNPVALVWIGGIALAALAYAVGPDHVVATALAALDRAGWMLSDILHNVTAAAFNAMRAAAIGLIGVFVALKLLAIARGQRGIGGLVVISMAFLLLVWGATGDGSSSNTRWLLALALAAAGAVSATNHLMHPGQRGWRLPR